MPDDLTRILQDLLVTFYMFAVRIGVPLLIVLLLGAWLKKVLEEPEDQPATAGDRAKTGEHCWEIKHCDENVRLQCAAFRRPDLPCWLAMQQDGSPVTEQCYTCPLWTAQPVPAMTAVKI